MNELVTYLAGQLANPALPLLERAELARRLRAHPYSRLIAAITIELALVRAPHRTMRPEFAEV